MIHLPYNEVTNGASKTREASHSIEEKKKKVVGQVRDNA